MDLELIVVQRLHFIDNSWNFKAINNGLSVGGTFCDLKKFFEYVNRGIIVDKLEFSGISGKFQTLIQTHLRDR